MNPLRRSASMSRWLLDRMTEAPHKPAFRQAFEECHTPEDFDHFLGKLSEDHPEAQLIKKRWQEDLSQLHKDFPPRQT